MLFNLERGYQLIIRLSVRKQKRVISQLSIRRNTSFQLYVYLSDKSRGSIMADDQDLTVGQFVYVIRCVVLNILGTPS